MRLLFAVMEVFISWSGKPAEAVAAELRDWLPVVHQVVRPWFSKQDIAAGSVWREEIREALQRAAFCIVCVTRHNLSSAWVNYEVGAIHEGYRKPVCPYLVGTDQSALTGLPLSHLQAEPATAEGTLRMMRALNAKSPQPLTEKVLERALKTNWKDLAKVLKEQEALLDADENESAALAEKDPPAVISDEDACNIITAMLKGLNGEDERSVFRYAELDQKFNFAPGTSSRVFKKAAKTVGYELQTPTDQTTLIHMPFVFASSRGDDRGWGRGGF